MEPITGIPSDVARRLGFYVYAYVNPLDDRIFYVGKGKGRRVLSHFKDQRDSRKVATLKQLRVAGKQPRIEILAHNLKTEDIAFQVEAAVIDVLGLPFLTNQVRGWRSATYGRTPLKELIAFYRRRPVRVRDASILVRVNQLYRPQMNALELYDATRGVWKIGPKRDRVRYALAVFEGVVREVYEITSWLPAGATLSSRNPKGIIVRGVGSSWGAWRPSACGDDTSTAMSALTSSEAPRVQSATCCHLPESVGAHTRTALDDFASRVGLLA